MVAIRSAYDGNHRVHAKACALNCPEPTRTKQADKDACDINKIVSRWMKSGYPLDLSARVGEFIDCADVPDYHACQNFLLRAQAMFDDLPSNIRSRFENDPAAFLAFATDAKNYDELVSLGLANAKPSSSTGDAALSNSASAASGEGVASGGSSSSSTSSPAKGE